MPVFKKKKIYCCVYNIKYIGIIHILFMKMNTDNMTVLFQSDMRVFSGCLVKVNRI